MSKRRKIILTSLSLVLLLSVCTIAFLPSLSTAPETLTMTEDQGYKVSLRYVNNGEVHELRSKEGYGTYLTKDGSEVEFLSTVLRDSSPLLSLPESSSSEDITKLKEPVQPYTWDSTLEESVSYLNFLSSQGFKPLTEATTSQFVEKYLSNGKSTIRVIVLKTVLIVGEVDEGIVLPSLENYLN